MRQTRIFKIFISFCRNIFPLRNYYFLLKTLDATKHYLPDSCTILDLPTSFAFFAGDPQATLRIVGEKVAKLLERWNEKFSKPKKVELFFSPSVQLIFSYGRIV